MSTVDLEAGREWGIPGSRIVTVPSRLEVLTTEGWEAHAVVLRRKPDRKSEGHFLVVFLADGRHYDTFERPFMVDEKLYAAAEANGLTHGVHGTDKPVLDARD